MFEFDKNKSALNKEKHGIDFEEAKEIWADPEVLQLPLKSDDEHRALYVGMIDGKLWGAITTHRGKNIRIISAHRLDGKYLKFYNKGAVK